MTFISNEALRLIDLPPRDARWDVIEMFALTFNGYSTSFGGQLDVLANKHRMAGTVPSDLSQLRAILFLEQRSWRHAMSRPDEAGLRFIWSLIDGIRVQLESR